MSTPDSSTGDRGRGRQPRNYLAGAERHRLFLRVVPPALVLLLLAGWIERAWFGRAPEPAAPPIDTVLARNPAGPSVTDSVRISDDRPDAKAESDPGTNAPESPASEPEAAAAPVGPSREALGAGREALGAGREALGAGREALGAGREALGAGREALARVRDDTLFRSDDEPAWSELCRSLVAMASWPPAAPLVRPVSFADLHGQSRALRGHLVGFRGIVRRLVPVEPGTDPDGTQPRWQAWIEPAQGPATPIVVYFLRLPNGMPHAVKMAEEVDVQGYFFKRWAYQATDAIRTAPLVLSLEPRWRPRRPVAPGGHAWGGWGLVAMTGLMAATWLALRFAGRRPPRAAAVPTGSWDAVEAHTQQATTWDFSTAERGRGESPESSP